MDDVDDFDLSSYCIRKDLDKTRTSRAVKKRDVFSKYGEQARLVLEALLDKYMTRVFLNGESFVLKTIHSEDLLPANIRLFGGKRRLP